MLDRGRGGDWEVVVVDDGSRDGTRERIEKLAGEWPWLRLVRHPHNRGQSAAICSGVAAAGFRWIVTLDADGQNVPADIPLLVEARDREGGGALLVAGLRVTRRDGWSRMLQMRVANVLRARILGDHCPDSGCGLKLFRREDFLRLPQFDHMHRFLPALFLRLGARAVYLPVGHRSRRTGHSKYGVFNRLFSGIIDLIGVAWLLRRPLDLESDVRIDDLGREAVALEGANRDMSLRRAQRSQQLAGRADRPR